MLFDELGGESERLGGLEKVENELAKVSVVRDMQGESRLFVRRRGELMG